MEQLIDLVTFSKKEKEGHKFYTNKFFGGVPFPQYEGTPQKDNPTPDDKYIDGMDSNAWWNLKLCATQYWEDHYKGLGISNLNKRGGKKSNAWNFFLREEKALSACEISYGNTYLLIETCARRTALHNVFRELMPNTYEKYFK